MHCYNFGNVGSISQVYKTKLDIREKHHKRHNDSSSDSDSSDSSSFNSDLSIDISVYGSDDSSDEYNNEDIDECEQCCDCDYTLTIKCDFDKLFEKESNKYLLCEKALCKLLANSIQKVEKKCDHTLDYMGDTDPHVHDGMEKCRCGCNKYPKDKYKPYKRGRPSNHLLNLVCNNCSEKSVIFRRSVIDRLFKVFINNYANRSSKYTYHCNSYYEDMRNYFELYRLVNCGPLPFKDKYMDLFHKELSTLILEKTDKKRCAFNQHVSDINCLSEIVYDFTYKYTVEQDAKNKCKNKRFRGCTKICVKFENESYVPCSTLPSTTIFCDEPHTTCHHTSYTTCHDEPQTTCVDEPCTTIEICRQQGPSDKKRNIKESINKIISGTSTYKVIMNKIAQNHSDHNQSNNDATEVGKSVGLPINTYKIVTASELLANLALQIQLDDKEIDKNSNVEDVQSDNDNDNYDDHQSASVNIATISNMDIFVSDTMIETNLLDKDNMNVMVPFSLLLKDESKTITQYGTTSMLGYPYIGRINIDTVNKHFLFTVSAIPTSANIGTFNFSPSVNGIHCGNKTYKIKYIQ